MNEDIERFRFDGYCLLRGVLDKCIVDRISLFLQNKANKILSSYEHVDNLADFIHRNFDKFSSTEKHLLSGHFDLATRLSGDLISILDSKPLTNVIKTVLGEENPKLHIPPAARWVLSGSKLAGVPPHQDISYNAHLNPFVVAWTPFTVIDDACGGVMVFPKLGKNIVFDTEKNNFWLSPVPTSGQGIHCKLELGDVLLLDPYIVHQSMPNKSSSVRISIDYRFYESKVNSGKHFMYIDDRVVLTP